MLTVYLTNVLLRQYEAERKDDDLPGSNEQLLIAYVHAISQPLDS
jgi:hypothetical protein